MAGPEAEAQAAFPGAAASGCEARHLQHGGIGAAVVHYAIVPSVVVAAEQDEGSVCVAAGGAELGLQDGGFAPTGVDLGVKDNLR